MPILYEKAGHLFITMPAKKYARTAWPTLLCFEASTPPDWYIFGPESLRRDAAIGLSARLERNNGNMKHGFALMLPLARLVMAQQRIILLRRLIDDENSMKAMVAEQWNQWNWQLWLCAVTKLMAENLINARRAVAPRSDERIRGIVWALADIVLAMSWCYFIWAKEAWLYFDNEIGDEIRCCTHPGQFLLLSSYAPDNAIESERGRSMPCLSCQLGDGAAWFPDLSINNRLRRE